MLGFQGSNHGESGSISDMGCMTLIKFQIISGLHIETGIYSVSTIVGKTPYIWMNLTCSLVCNMLSLEMVEIHRMSLSRIFVLSLVSRL